MKQNEHQNLNNFNPCNLTFSLKQNNFTHIFPIHQLHALLISVEVPYDFRVDTSVISAGKNSHRDPWVRCPPELSSNLSDLLVCACPKIYFWYLGFPPMVLLNGIWRLLTVSLFSRTAAPRTVTRLLFKKEKKKEKDNWCLDTIKNVTKPLMESEPMNHNCQIKRHFKILSKNCH